MKTPQRSYSELYALALSAQKFVESESDICNRWLQASFSWINLTLLLGCTLNIQWALVIVELFLFFDFCLPFEARAPATMRCHIQAARYVLKKIALILNYTNMHMHEYMSIYIYIYMRKNANMYIYASNSLCRTIG